MTALDMRASYTEINAAIGALRGWGLGASPDGTGSAAWAANQLAWIANWRRAGLRSFYHHAMLPSMRSAHFWSFLKAVATIDVFGINKSTVATSAYPKAIGGGAGSGYTLVTLNDAVVYPSSVGATVTVGAASLTIAGYGSATSFTVSGDQTAAFAAASAVEIDSNGMFRLPTDFGEEMSDFTYAPGSGYGQIQVTDEGRIRRMWSPQAPKSGPPALCALQALAIDGTSQGWRMITDLVPDKPYPLSYAYRILPGDLDATSNAYPYGAATHAQTIIEACLAEAERDMGSDRTHAERYLELLTSSIQMDRQMAAPEVIGRKATTWASSRSERRNRHSNATWL